MNLHILNVYELSRNLTRLKLFARSNEEIQRLAVVCYKKMVKTSNALATVRAAV
jgi:hypothetical protein